MNRFWQSWRSKFNSKHPAVVVDGLCDVKYIADRFASVFQSVCVPNSEQRHQELATNFFRMYSPYVGNDFDVNEITPDYLHDCIGRLKKGKAPGFHDFTSEYIIYAHPLLALHLSHLFRMVLQYCVVPDGFCKGVVVLLVKNHDGNQCITDNYRGITISPAISKLFEIVLFNRQLSCNHALFTMKTIIEHYVSDGSTVNICALDINKAFDRVNHFALLKVADRKLPRAFIGVMLDWLSKSTVCVKWAGIFSFWFCNKAGVRQGGVLSPVLFAVFMDTLIERA